MNVVKLMTSLIGYDGVEVVSIVAHLNKRR
jgi:hypothetical protein